MNDRSTGDVATLAEALAAAASRLNVVIRPPLLAFGLSLPQARVLAQVVERGPLRITDLSVAEQVAQPSMTALVAGLARQGWVTRTPDAEDARAVRVQVTQDGLEVLRAARSARAAATAERRDSLTEQERGILRAAVPILERLSSTG
jgi:DNA-binding MarR family transcriptional regulator